MKRWKDLTWEERTPEAGLREARLRIKEWKRGSLDLAGLELKEIPEEITNVKNLVFLRLYGNQIIDLRPLSGLLNLKKLILWDNQIIDLRPLASLSNLTELWLDKNQIIDLRPLSGLSNLIKLKLGDNQIIDLRPLVSLSNLTELWLDKNKIIGLRPLASLSYLTNLVLGSNQIIDLRPLASLSNLMYLGLGGNQIIDLRPLSGLSNLDMLELVDNQIIDLRPLSGLSNLDMLGLGGNQIIDLRPLSILLNKGVDLLDRLFGRVGGICFQGCPLTDPPLEIARRGTQETLRYWELVDRLQTYPNREGRVLLIGNGASGKTSLQDKLFNPEVIITKGERRSTVGINIKKDLPFHYGGETYNARVWDFGGQVEQHAIHQYFFGRRSLYVVVIDRRSEEHYDQWLRMINLLGLREGEQKTPVILLFNERENKRIPQTTYNIDVYEGQYPALELIPYSVDLGREDESQLPVADRKGNDPRWPGFLDLLARQLSELPVMVDILTPYAKFPARLEKERRANRPYLDFAAFGEVCQSLELEYDTMWQDAANYLHAIGEVIHFSNLPEKSLLRRYVIIDVVWATEAIYKVLQLPNIVENDGAFTRADLETAWLADYSAEDRELLRELLLEDAFEICYRLPTGSDFDFLAPSLLPEVDEVTGWKSPADGLFFRLRYNGPVPTGIVSRLIVRLNDLLDGHRRYRYGAVFNDPKSDLQALVRHRRSLSGANNEIEIEVNGRGGVATDFLSHLRTEFTRIHDQFFHGLRPKEVFACCCSACQISVPAHKSTFVYGSLLKRLKARETDIFCDNLESNVSILEVLYGVYPEADERIQLLLTQNKELLNQNKEMLQRVRRVDATTQDTNARVQELAAALTSVQTDLERQGETLFTGRAERRVFMNRLEELAESLPEAEQPDPEWYEAPLVDKIKVGVDLVKVLHRMTGVELSGLNLKWERELNFSRAALPDSWAAFKQWFIKLPVS